MKIFYKTCVVPQCKSTSIKTPNKLFIYVPNNKKIRSKWLSLAGRDDAKNLSNKSRMYFCEDHFDLPNDMQNYVQYNIMGTVSRVRMKSGCMPSLFKCQKETKRTPSLTEQLQILTEVPELKLNTHPDAEILPKMFTKSSSSVSSLCENSLIKVERSDSETSNIQLTSLYTKGNTVMSAAEEPAINGDSTNIKHECRTCLQWNNPVGTFLLFQSWSPGWGDMESTIAEDLERIANIQVSEMDKHSKFICISCSEQLKAACEFVSLVQKNDKILKQRYSATDNISCQQVWPKPIQIDKPVALENLLNVEVKQEVLSDNEYDCYPEEEHILPDFDDQLDIKVEPEEIVEPTSPNITINGHCTLQSTKIENMENGDAHFSDEFSEGKVKEEPISDNEDTDLEPGDLPLECLLCTRTFISVSGLKAHVIAQHSYKTVRRKMGDSPPQKSPRMKFTCAICKRSFLTTTDLMVHETCHNKDVCYGCNAKFDSFDKLSAHRKLCKALLSKEVVKPKTLDDVIRPPSETSGIPNLMEHNKEKSEEPEMLSCDLCTFEQFSDSYFLTIHKEIHHSKDNSDIQLKNEPIPMDMETLENIFNEDSTVTSNNM